MPIREYAVDGDQGFIGLNSRDNPVNLGKNFVSKSVNFRMDRGVSTLRKGVNRLTTGALVGESIYCSCTYTQSNGSELIVMAIADGIYTYNPDTGGVSSKYLFPGAVSGATYTSADGITVVVTKAAHGLTTGNQFHINTSATPYGGNFIITAYTTNTFTYVLPTAVTPGSGTATYNSTNIIWSTDEVDMYQAQGIGYVYVCRGFSKVVLRWDGASTISIPGVSSHNNYPNSRHAIYFNNRHLVQTDGNTFQVSHYLSDATWSALDMFSVNDGANDRLIAITPWQLNEFVIFMRNSIFYASVGVGANALGDAVTEPDSYVKSLATDIGCIARGSIVQAGGGIIFLSDNGVYIANPGGVGAGAGNTPEGMRLLTAAEPLSATISDVIQRINYNYVDRCVSAYWENRYYLAVPLDSSTVNNSILVYNFVNKAWESVDTYVAGFDIQSFAVAKKGNRRRLFSIDREQGVHLLEELDYDEYGTATGTPFLPLAVPPATDGVGFTLGDVAACFLSTASYTPNQIFGELITRGFTFNTNRDKRFSSAQADVYAPGGGVIYTQIITSNPDITTTAIRYGSASDEDATIRIPVRKTGYSAQVRFTTTNSRPSVRSVTLEAIIPGHMTQTRK